jgi:hypothetical protein
MSHPFMNKYVAEKAGEFIGNLILTIVNYYKEYVPQYKIEEDHIINNNFGYVDEDSYTDTKDFIKLVSADLLR